MNEKVDNYLRGFISYIHVLSTAVFIIVDIFLLQYFVTKNTHVRICIYPVTFVWSLVLWCLRLICCMVTHKYLLGMIHLPHLVWQESPPYLYHKKMDGLLTNKREVESHLTDALNKELYERNIVGGCNTTRLMDFLSMARTYFSKNWLFGEGGGGVYN